MAAYVASAYRGNRVRQTGTYDGSAVQLATGGAATGYQSVQDAVGANVEFPCWVTSTGGDFAQYGVAYHAGATGGTVQLSWRWSESYGTALATGQAVIARIGPMAEGQAFPGVVAKADSISVPNGGTNVTGWSDLHDPFGMWSATGMNFTLPSWVGAFQVSAHGQWDAATGGTYRSMRISRCGQNPAEAASGAAGANLSLTSPVVGPSESAVTVFLDQDSATGVPVMVEVSIQVWPGYHSS